MNGYETLLVAGLGWSLRASVVLGAAWLLTTVLRRTSAAVRHTIWAAALTGTLALPLVLTAVPRQWEIRAPMVPEWIRPSPAEPTMDAPDRAAPRASDLSAAAMDGSSAETGPGTAGSRATLPATSGAGADRGRLALWALGLWGTGTFLVLAFLVRGGFTVIRLRAEGRPLERPGVRDRVDLLALRSGVAGQVEVLRSDEITVPITGGLFRPVVLLPTDTEGHWSNGRLEAVLLHEFAHVRRRDLLAHIVGRVVCAFHWFNPLVWIAAKRMGRESERACDDVVLRAGTRPSAYAQHLLDIVKAGRRGLGSAPALSMARRTDFEGRVLALLDGDNDRGPIRAKVLAGITTAAVVLLVLVSLPGAGKEEASEAGETSSQLEDVGSPLEQVGLDPGSTEGAVVETLMGLLGDDHPMVREAAARALGDRGTREAVPQLVEMLSDPDEEVREEAAVALGLIRAPSAVTPLARALVTDEDGEVREAAAWALGETESAEAVDRLAEALRSVRHAGLRHDIVEALGETGQASAVQVLEGMLGGRDHRLQRRVLEALAEIGSDEAMNVLVGAMQSEDASLRRMAARALGQRG